MTYNYISSHTDFSSVICVPAEVLTAEVSMTAKQIYIYLFNRSRQILEEDDIGFVFTTASYSEMGKDLDVSRSTVKRALHELDDEGLIIRKRMGRGKVNRIYVLVPEKNRDNKETK